MANQVGSTKFRRVSAIFALTASLLCAGIPVGTANASNLPVYAVMNTSESPPDGVWFRNSPSSADTDRVTGLGVYMGERVRLLCYASGEAVGPYGNTIWYQSQNVSRTSVNGRPNEGFLNAHYVDDGQSANIAAPGVAACGATEMAPDPGETQAPTLDPEIQLRQGNEAPLGFWYDVRMQGFPANSQINVSCHDTVDSDGFYTATVSTDMAGNAAQAMLCYSADGPTHWVIANGVESNRAEWNGQPAVPPLGPPAEPSAGSVPPVATQPAPDAPENCAAPEGVSIAGGSVAYKLYDHYMWGNGESVVIEWEYFASNPAFVEWAKNLPISTNGDVFRASVSSDMFFALGSFTVVRTSQSCFTVLDTYDFRPTAELKKLGWTALTLPQWAYQLSGSREFDVQAGGAL